MAEGSGDDVSGERWFSWRYKDGRQIDWWSHHVAGDKTRFVHNEWGRFALAVDLNMREAQIQFNNPPDWHSIVFNEIFDEDSRFALEAACDARQPRFAAELFLRIIGRDDMIDLMYVPKETPRAT